MSMWSRVANVFRGDRVSREIDEEFAAHLDEAVAEGRDPVEARRAFGSALRQREESRDARVVGWMDSLRADVVFGWRQLKKRKVTTAAAVLSLGLGIGACTAAFRLVDALFLRPLPVSDPGNLYVLAYDGLNGLGKPAKWDESSYPLFQQMRDAVKGQATLIATNYTDHADLTFGGYQEMEQAYLTPVSGEYFSSLGLQPVVGRLLMQQDDLVPKAKPYAVLSYDYWTRRFGRDASVVGKRFHKDDADYEVVGVAPKGFTGIEPGTMVDVFTPTMMDDSATNKNDFGLRIFARPEPGVKLEVLQSELDAVFQRSEKERAKTFNDLPKNLQDGWPNAHLQLKSAAAGISYIQEQYGSSLIALVALVGMVLLIGCMNVANLMSAQAEARLKEMALRISLGSGRRRLVRMMLVERTMLGLMAAALGVVFALWAAPLVVSRMSPPSYPVRLALPADWMVLGFGLALGVGVTLLSGLVPALRASRVQPVKALKGEESRGQRRLMHGLIAA